MIYDNLYITVYVAAAIRISLCTSMPFKGGDTLIEKKNDKDHLLLHGNYLDPSHTVPALNRIRSADFFDRRCDA